MLDNAGDDAVGIAQDPPIPARIRDLGSQYSCGGPALPMLEEQLAKRLAGEHRHVSQSNDHVATEISKLIKRDLDRVAGAELLLLHRDQHMGCDLGEVGFHLITEVADHDDDVLGLHGRRSRHRVTEHGMSGDFVQQLGT